VFPGFTQLKLFEILSDVLPRQSIFLGFWYNSVVVFVFAELSVAMANPAFELMKCVLEVYDEGWWKALEL